MPLESAVPLNCILSEDSQNDEYEDPSESFALNPLLSVPEITISPVTPSTEKSSLYTFDSLTKLLEEFPILFRFSVVVSQSELSESKHFHLFKTPSLVISAPSALISSTL